MTEKYANCNLRRLQDDFPSLSDRIALRLTPPMEFILYQPIAKHLKRAKNGKEDTTLDDTDDSSDV